MKIIFFGTSNVALPILDKLHQNQEVLAVVTSPDAPVGRKQTLTESPVSELAKKLNIPTLKPTTLKGEHFDTNCPPFSDADIFIVVSYGKILPKELLETPPLKTLNVHFSLLPEYRGAAPVQWAIAKGETKTGTTIFILDELLDHGPILAQKEIEIDEKDTTPTLLEKLSQISADLLIEILPRYTKGEIEPQTQDHDKATKAPIIKKTDGLLDFTNSAKVCYNTYRAFKPWPGVYMYFQGKILKILDCAVLENSPIQKSTNTQTQIGVILPGGIVACGNNTFLQLNTVQLEGGKPMPVSDFLRGHEI